MDQIQQLYLSTFTGIEELDDFAEIFFYSAMYIVLGSILGKMFDKMLAFGDNQNKTKMQLWLEIVLQASMNIVLGYMLRQFVKYGGPYIPLFDFDKEDRFGSRATGGILLAFAITAGQTNFKNKVALVLADF